jgi:acetyl-CoA carboxylase carboxyl transferase subunit alpha
MSRTAWETVEIARHPDRPYALDYIRRIAPDFVELHGDRMHGDDPALVGGIGSWEMGPTVFLGQQKGRNLQERIHRNFGMMHPEGYRKAMRLARQAVRFRFPVVCMVDTPGAYPGLGAEERGIASAIGAAIMEWFRIDVPVVTAVIGEGGSGGAVALGVADRVLMLEHAIYSVAMPEACGTILWRDGAHSSDAANQLRLTSSDALALRVADEIVTEPCGGAHVDLDDAARRLAECLRAQIAPLRSVPPGELLRLRRERFRERWSPATPSPFEAAAADMA